MEKIIKKDLSDVRVKDLIEILKELPQDAHVSAAYGYDGGPLSDITLDGESNVVTLWGEGA